MSNCYVNQTVFYQANTIYFKLPAKPLFYHQLISLALKNLHSTAGSERCGFSELLQNRTLDNFCLYNRQKAEIFCGQMSSDAIFTHCTKYPKILHLFIQQKSLKLFKSKARAKVTKVCKSKNFENLRTRKARKIIPKE